MVGAYAGSITASSTGSFLLAVPAGLAAAAVTGLAIEYLVIRKLYDRDHLDQVLATYGLVLLFNESVSLIFGRQPLFVGVPPALSGSVEILPGMTFSVYRLTIIVAGLVIAAGLYALIQRTRLGMLIRAGATNRDMVRALGVDIKLLYTLVFGLGALLAGFAGVMAGPLLSVQVGMGEQILIMTFVVVVVGGVGSIRGALFGAIVVGLVDTLLRAFLPQLVRGLLADPSEADQLSAGLASMGVYVLMAIVLLWRPQGLFPARS
jgi:branched-chain amino acid transport system permease protein